jgi:hypothetical protein
METSTMSLQHSRASEGDGPHRPHPHRGEPAAYTVDEFCTAHRIGRSHLYKLWRAGVGPRFFLVGNKRRISNEAASDWRRQGEAAAGAV